MKESANESPGKEIQEAPAPAAGADLADAGSMDKIRDILFGNQARDYDKRFSKMEEHLGQEITGLKSELLKRVDTLETYVKQEIKDINTRLKSESKERSQEDVQLQKDLKEIFETLNRKLSEEAELLAERSTELREQILEQSKSLSNEIAARHEQATSSLKQAAQELDDAKMNRSDLSGFLLDVAMRISGDDLMGKS